MSTEIEISSLDLRYSSYRIQSKSSENILLISIRQKGVLEPLIGVDVNNCHILLDGFKRLRCAISLVKNVVPYTSIASNETEGLLSFLRLSNSKSMSILEQAQIISDLITIHKMNACEIAEYLCKSKSWVSVRRGLIESIPELIKDKLFKEEFPVYSYMYTIRQFMRINKVPKEDVEDFINLTSGRKLSVRQIETLANGYFKGSDNYRDALRSGSISYLLTSQKVSNDKNGYSKGEQNFLWTLDTINKYMSNLLAESSKISLENGAFKAQASILCGGIMRMLDDFSKQIKEFYDKTGEV